MRIYNTLKINLLSFFFALTLTISFFSVQAQFLPIANFTYTTVGLTVSFTDQSTNGPQSWFWDFNDGTTSLLQNPAHTYAANGTYAVCLVVTNPSGTSTFCDTIVLGCPIPVSAYTYAVNGLTVDFLDQSTNNPTAWNWSFPGGTPSSSTLQNPSVTYPWPGQVGVTLVVSNACGAHTRYDTVQVGCQTPQPQFSTTTIGLTAAFTDLSAGVPNFWTWYFGDGNTSTQQNPNHTYASAGVYNVCLEVMNACSTLTYCQLLTVANPCQVAVNLGNDTLVQNFLVLNAYDPGFVTYLWSNGSTSSVITVNMTGCYWVEVTDANGCLGADTICVTMDSNCVWPGDANDDMIADNNDVLAIGLAYGTNGSPRQNATLNWTCQPSNDWVPVFLGGVNYKHADCDGNGLVDSLDMDAVNLNYGLTHNKNHSVQGGGLNDPGLYFDTLQNAANTGDTLILSIALGRDTLPVDSAYGIAFTLNFDPTLIDSGTFSFYYGNSWLGNLGNNLIRFEKEFHPNGRLDMAITRINQTDIAGFGEIVQIGLVLQDDIAAKQAAIVDTLHLFFTDVRLISANGMEIAVQTENGQVEISEEANGLFPAQNSENVKIFPNPSQGIVTILAPGTGLETARLFDLSGREVSNTDGLQNESIFKSGNQSGAHKETWILDGSHLSPGIYFLSLEGNGQIFTRKIILTP